MMKTLTLPSGRKLDYEIYGDPNGLIPLIFLHGTPAAYPCLTSLNNACKSNNLKLISFSRAGYGGSTRDKGRKNADIVDDVKALLDHLGHEKCVAAGWSGGGPLVLACAARLPGCLAALSVAAVGPYGVEGLDFLKGQGQDNIDEFHAAMKGEDEVRKFTEAQRSGLLEADAAAITEQMSSILSEVDKKAILENKEMGSDLATMFHEALRISCDGWIDDDLAFVQHWGFELDEIKVPVFLYQGSEDLMVPYAHGQWLADHIPEAYLTKHLEDGEGHVSIWLSNLDTMMKELLEVVRKQRSD